MKHTVTGYFFILAVICIVLAFYSSSQLSSFTAKNIAVSPTPDVLGASNVLTTTIARVIDGDTVVTSGDQKVRYIGINAPETGQPYGAEATAFDRQLVQGKNVQILFGAQQKDQYGRLLGYVYVGKTLVNVEIVKNGWAVAENIPPNTTHKNEIDQAEKIAKQTCQGLWSDTCMPQTNSCLKISTIVYDAPGVDDQNENGEWVELTNNCPAVVDLSGWLLKDSSASNSYTFGAISIPMQESIKIHSGCGINTSTDLYWQCPAKQHAIWNNTGDEAMLFDNHGKLLSVYSY
jgi:micrococcal nuclease